jgi:hypothetical protein
MEEIAPTLFWVTLLAMPFVTYFLGRERDHGQGIPRGPGFWHLRFYTRKMLGKTG